jgi:hypothetical protein
MFVFVETWRSEVGFNGVITAIADTTGRDALKTRRTRNTFHLLAIVALWAGVVEIACPATEAKPIRVFYARGGSITKAAIGCLARQTEAWKVGYAHVLPVSTTARNERTIPPLGTVRVAGLGADLIPQMIRAYARVAIVGRIAWLSETPSSFVAFWWCDVLWGNEGIHR